MKRFVFHHHSLTSAQRWFAITLWPLATALSALPRRAWAQTVAASEPAAGSSSLGWFGGELLLLALLGACAWTVIYVLRRKRRFPSGHNDERVHVLGITPLGTRERLAVLRVRDRTLLVGVTAAQITLLADLGAAPGTSIDRAKADVAAEAATGLADPHAAL
jgi:flagellar biosynthetic protein FliO